MELHRTVGVVLEGLFADDLEPHLAEIAYHLSQAAPLGEAARAVEYSVRAGDRAAAVLAYEDSVRQYERALMLLPPSEATSARRAGILLRLGDARSRAGHPTARGTFEEAAGIGRGEADPELLAEAALGYARVLEPVQLVSAASSSRRRPSSRPRRSRCSRTRSRRCPKATARCVLEHSRALPPNCT